MKPKSIPSWRCSPSRGCPSWTRSRRRALTLIELLAALAVLSVLLSGLLLAKNRLQRQWVRSELTLRAAAEVDQLLTQWRRHGSMPEDGAGEFGQDGLLAWRTSPVRSQETRTLNAQIVRLEVIERDAEDDEPVLAVEVLVPKERQPEEGRRDPRPAEGERR